MSLALAVAEFFPAEPEARRRNGRFGPMHPRSWTAEELAELQALVRDFDGDAGEAAIVLGRGLGDVGRALNALLGRTPADAARALQRLALGDQPE